MEEDDPLHRLGARLSVELPCTVLPVHHQDVRAVVAAALHEEGVGTFLASRETDHFFVAHGGYGNRSLRHGTDLAIGCALTVDVRAPGLVSPPYFDFFFDLPPVCRYPGAKRDPTRGWQRMRSPLLPMQSLLWSSFVHLLLDRQYPTTRAATRACQGENLREIWAPWVARLCFHLRPSRTNRIPAPFAKRKSTSPPLVPLLLAPVETGDYPKYPFSCTVLPRIPRHDPARRLLT